MVLLLAGAIQQCYAADSLRAAGDNYPIEVRSFNKERLMEYARDKHFQYKQGKGQLNWWARFWSWVWYNIRRVFEGMRIGNGTWTVLKYVLLIIAIGFLVFIALKLAGVDVIKVIAGKSAKTTIPYTEGTDNIHEIDFDIAIDEAIAAKNYKLAVRLLYLKSLKYLSNAQLIDWHIEKTNADYVHELVNATQYKSFNQLTYQFEYIWYGDFPIDAQRFQQINELFLELKKQLP